MITIYKKVFDELIQTITRLNNALIQKLEDAPKIIKHGENETHSKEQDKRLDNIIKSEHSGDSQGYIFGRLKRDAELGDERAIEVVLSKSRK
ncbi:hypothetical protein [Cyanobacterium aponinum]|uniref:hypothetical protein n=1 Tax=Cyanobacterium aponinum TaxID=379064 RepID=UPI000C12D6FA|nr:hypothetical protein [Cyanobacterium aponinum]PHV61026.1 hypothetical protein CSQ80_17755 [Cyanobacterium aponinum IPPAS B-1201]